MDNFQKTAILILFPVVLLVLFIGMWAFIYSPPETSLSVQVNFQKGYVNVTELWIFNSNMSEGVFRSFPVGGVFSNMTITKVNCRGEAVVAYDGYYQVTCYDNFTGASFLGLNYVLNNPYTCYEDYCYFESKMFEGGRVGPIEFKVSGANKFDAYPHPDFQAGYGLFTGEASSGYFFATVPSFYSEAKFSGRFSETFDNIIKKYSKDSSLEKNWMVNLFILVTIESFIAFMLYLILGMEHTVYSTKYIHHPPSLRSPHVISDLFFPDIPRSDVISATLVDLARRGYLEVTKRNLRLHPRQIQNRFEHQLLFTLSKLSKNGVITLDRAWIKKRIDEVGKTEFQDLLNQLKHMPVISRSDAVSVRDKLGDHLVLLMQGAFVGLSLIMFIIAPNYLVNYKTSLMVLTLINLFWMFLSWRLGLTTFSKYTHEAATEKSLWMAYKRFVRSEVNIEKEQGLNWNYVLSFATLFGFENKVLKVAEKKRVYFDHMYNARLATQAYNLINRASH